MHTVSLTVSRSRPRRQNRHPPHHHNTQKPTRDSPPFLNARRRAPPRMKKTERVEKPKPSRSRRWMTIRARARRTVLTSEPTDQSARTVTSRVATYIVAHRVASSVARSRSRRHPFTSYRAYLLGRGTRSSRIIHRRRSIDRSRNDRTLATREARLSAEPFRAMDALAETMRCVVVVAEACMTASVCADRIDRSIDRRCHVAGVVVSQDWSCV